MRRLSTRAIVFAALDGEPTDVPTKTDPYFGFAVRSTCSDVPAEILGPGSTPTDKDAYNTQAMKLAAMFAAKFKDFANEVSEEVCNAGPHV